MNKLNVSDRFYVPFHMTMSVNLLEVKEGVGRVLRMPPLGVYLGKQTENW
jgi:hypothetical protein